MNAVAARRSGAPSAPVRASSLVLAALATGAPLFLLILGLSIQTFQAMRERQLSVELIPLPPSPPPEPETPHPSPARPAERAAAPAPAAPRPATVIDTSTPIAPQPVPALSAADVSGSGTATNAGSSTGGNGPGGNGSGPSGGTAPAAPVRTGASWLFKPGTVEMRPYNPPLARSENVNGRVLLRCRVLRSGRVTDCAVTGERPRGYGFGRAALQVSRLFLLQPPTLNGEPDEARRVEIPVEFNNRR